MSMQPPQSSLQQNRPMQGEALVVPFSALDGRQLLLAGGKAANLGELTHAGLPVPSGFCVTTDAYGMVAQSANLEALLADLAATARGDSTRLHRGADAMRTSLLNAAMPAFVAKEITAAYRALGENVPVAVRSSATAEDLPFASFAGQQDTYLNIVGEEAVLDAVRRCWSSLWTDRAVSYRATNGIDPHTVQLAVVVQRMVDAKVAGVLFTANPLTGHRYQMVIDASPGLGEAVVSGAVNPDHFLVNTHNGDVIEQRLGDKRVVIQSKVGGGTERIELEQADNEPALSPRHIRELVALGAKVAKHYGAPQDIEWALDEADTLWLTQARPITTLYPLPDDAPTTDEVLRVYFSLNAAQGVYQPLTPMGINLLWLLGSSMARVAGFPPADPLSGPAFIKIAGDRMFFDITTALQTEVGRTLLTNLMKIGEARSSEMVQQIVKDPRLPLHHTSRFKIIRHVLGVVRRGKVPPRALEAFFRPAKAQKRIRGMEADIDKLADRIRADAPAKERLTTIENVLIENMAPMVFRVIPPALLAGFGSYALAGRLLGHKTITADQQVILRGLPANPTTEMGIALWHISQKIAADPAAARALQERPMEELVQEYHDQQLPQTLQTELVTFMQAYGHRGVAEIDAGLPRWSEDPTHILGMLANYLQLKNPDMAPDIQFRRLELEAEAMVKELSRRGKYKGFLRGPLVGYLLKRTRLLVGLREVPKFFLVKMLAAARESLWKVGDELASAGRIEQPGDIFFLTIKEAKASLDGTNYQELVRARRTEYDQEFGRRHIPHILLSDGTEPTVQAQEGASDADLTGSPASAGVVTGTARVILDPNGARLEPGEILVAPSTDPGWTPLFLTAGGLVMEMGGAMSHGAVVAREYGIPAVVGVKGATAIIESGQQIKVDGLTGTIHILKDE